VVPVNSSASSHVKKCILCGGWCDVWSLGRTVVTLYVGKTGHAKEYIEEVSSRLKISVFFCFF